VLVLHEGRPVELGDASPSPRFELRLSGVSLAEAERLLGAVPGVTDIDCALADGVVTFRCAGSDPLVADALARVAIAHGRLLSLESQRASLEDRFIAAMRREDRAPPDGRQPAAQSAGAAA
jgi:hypothetical protein